MCYKDAVKPDRRDELVAKRARTMNPEIGILAYRKPSGTRTPFVVSSVLLLLAASAILIWWSMTP
jgi:hypothetical protein